MSRPHERGRARWRLGGTQPAQPQTSQPPAFCPRHKPEWGLSSLPSSELGYLLSTNPESRGPILLPKGKKVQGIGKSSVTELAFKEIQYRQDGWMMDWKTEEHIVSTCQWQIEEEEARRTFQKHVSCTQHDGHHPEL